MLVVGEIRVSSDGFKEGRISPAPNGSPHYSEGTTARDTGWSCLGLVTREVLPLDSLEREFGVNNLLGGPLLSSPPTFQCSVQLVFIAETCRVLAAGILSVTQ